MNDFEQKLIYRISTNKVKRWVESHSWITRYVHETESRFDVVCDENDIYRKGGHIFVSIERNFWSEEFGRTTLTIIFPNSRSHGDVFEIGKENLNEIEHLLDTYAGRI